MQGDFFSDIFSKKRFAEVTFSFGDILLALTQKYAKGLVLYKTRHTI